MRWRAAPSRFSQARAGPRIGAEDLRDQRVEIRAVIEVDEMRHLMRDGGAAHEVGREDQPPAVADRALARAAAPARDRIADADAAPAARRPSRRYSRVSRVSSASASAFSQRRMRRSRPSSGPPQISRPASSLIRRGRDGVPVDDMGLADRRARVSPGAKGCGRRDVGQRALDPLPMLAGPGQRPALRDPARHGQQHRARARVDAEPQLARARRHASA